MAELDVFNDKAFRTRSLSVSMDKLPYQPKILGSMNLFTTSAHTSELFTVEEQNGKLTLVESAARGTLEKVTTRSSRQKRPFQTVHLPQVSSVMADEVSGIRAFGSETEIEAVSKVVNDLLTAHKSNIEATKEFQRVGAIQGNVLDADGSTVIENLFDAFSITETELDVNFTTPDPLKPFCTSVIRAMEDALGNDVFTGIVGICGNTYWDALLDDDEVKAAYDRWQNGQFLRDNQLRTGFPYGGINWMNYRGQVGDIKFIADDVCRFVPTGVRDLFVENYAPAPFEETVNTRALPFYAKQERMEFDLGRKIMSCSDILCMCNRPAVLIKSTGTVA